jgi:hypothetical protein
LNCFCGVPSTYSNAAYEEIMEMVEDLLELKKIKLIRDLRKDERDVNFTKTWTVDNVVESTRNSDDEISTKA